MNMEEKVARLEYLVQLLLKLKGNYLTLSNDGTKFIETCPLCQMVQENGPEFAKHPYDHHPGCPSLILSEKL